MAATIWWMLALALAAEPVPDRPILFDPVSGYRLTQYRGVVDRVPEGVRLVDARQVAMRRGTAVMIDVTPAEGAVRQEDGRWRLAVPHATVPGAHWFPEAGRGVLSPAIDGWFARGIARLTRGRRSSPIVVFCLADCWMSWNAALRLRRAGYTDVSWFADGVDGWREAGRPLMDARPQQP